MRLHLLTAVLIEVVAFAALGGCPESDGSCRASTDCEDGEVCVERWCRSRCELPSDCGDGERCLEGACLPLGRPCVTDDVCLSIEACVEGECRLSCRGDQACPDGDVCLGGICLGAPDAAIPDAAVFDRSVDAAPADAAGVDAAPRDRSVVADGPGPPSTHLIFRVEPSDAEPGEALRPAVEVWVVDGEENLVPSATAEISLALLVSPCGGAMQGTTATAAVAGVATFDDLRLDTPGAGYVLEATAVDLLPARSVPFDVAGGPVSLVDSTGAGQGLDQGVGDNVAAAGGAFEIVELDRGEGAPLHGLDRGPFGLVDLRDLVVLLHLDGAEESTLGDGSVLADASGRGHHAVLFDQRTTTFDGGAPPSSSRYVSGVLGQGVEIATEDHIALGNVGHIDFAFGQGGFSWALWVRPTPCGGALNQSNSIYIGGHGDEGGRPHVWLGLDCPDSHFVFRASDTGGVGGSVSDPSITLGGDGEWRHLVGVVEPLVGGATYTTSHLYVDGVGHEKAINLDPAEGFSSWGDILLGQFPGLWTYATSLAVDELAFFSRALGEREVTQLHARQRFDRAVGTFTSRPHVATGTGCPPIWSGLEWQPERPVGRELPDLGAVETAYPSGNIDMSDNLLLLHLNGEEGRELLDSEAIADRSPLEQTINVATSGGSAQVVPGRLRQALYLHDGAFAALTSLGPDADWDLGSRDLTWALWVRLPAVSCTENQVAMGATGGPVMWLGAMCEGGASQGCARWRVNDDRGDSNVVTHHRRIDDGLWHHLVGVKSGHASPTLVLYVDGEAVEVAGGDADPYGGTFDFTDGASVRLGGLDTSEEDYPTDLVVDEVAVWRRALAAEEAQALYARGALSLALQVRNCPDVASCTGQPFVGPDGTPQSSFTGADAPPGLPIVDLSPLQMRDPVLQYRVRFESIAAEHSPRLRSVTLRHVVGP